jgi:glycosyltransferase involved in cell wall biosynthesis
MIETDEGIESKINIEESKSEIFFITSYPPRECGIATYSQDLIKAINNKFGDSLNMHVCALEAGITDNIYPDEVKLILDTTNVDMYTQIAEKLNNDKGLKTILIQHEFGFFENAEECFLNFLKLLTKNIIIGFHTVLPHPDETFKKRVQEISEECSSIIVMTKNSARILASEYGIPEDKIEVIAHGTHLVVHHDKNILKEKYGLTGRKVLTTFGLLSSGKSIETTLDALPSIIEMFPEIIFLAIGKTHPGVVKSEGEKYRSMLEEKVDELKLHNHILFINRYLPLPDLLEYLQLTDIYLFTSKDPNQAVSGTFAYAMSCACPIISTPIPHAQEVLRKDTGIIFDFKNSEQLSTGILRLFNDKPLLSAFTSNTLQRIVPTAWENSAIAHAVLFKKIANRKINLKYRWPEINLNHIKKMTTDFGMIQFSKFDQPDIESGFTLDDNARALIALTLHFDLTADKSDLILIRTYLRFISFCQQENGSFLNYVDKNKKFTSQNEDTNLEDANGRALWALGYLISKQDKLPQELISVAIQLFEKAKDHIASVHSSRAMAFAIKGLYFANISLKSTSVTLLITTLADRLVQMYRHEAETNWEWFESYLTYANSVLPEAMIYAWLETDKKKYRDIAELSFDFLLSKTFNDKCIKVISNNGWMNKGEMPDRYGEQPIDVTYTILALKIFYKVFRKQSYLEKTEIAFSWFLGKNHLQQIIYNPSSGGSYDGLEETVVNLNQGAESTLSYLLARLTLEEFTSVWKKYNPKESPVLN